MAKVTKEYVRAAFYRMFAMMPKAQREGIIEALRATSEVMETAAPEANSASLFDEQPEPDSEGGEV